MAVLQDRKIRKLIADAEALGLGVAGLHTVVWTMAVADKDAHDLLIQAIKWIWDDQHKGFFDYTGLDSASWNARWVFWFTDADAAFAFKMRWC